MKPTITGFADAPDGGRGFARDMRVRWALEEVGQPYDVRLLSFEELKQPAHLALQPFGEIPTYEDGTVELFETGAIVLHIAETHPGLLPADPAARSRAIAWMFAALSTVEPVVVAREAALLEEADKPWADARMPIMEDRIRGRFGFLQDALGDRDWLSGAFSAGDLMMSEVLLRLDDEDDPAGVALLGHFPALKQYTERARARPAFERALAAQHQVFVDAQRRG
jgi:glutathione S-transferase